MGKCEVRIEMAWSAANGWEMRPTQRSVIVKQRINSLDGPWRQERLPRARKIKVLPRVAVMANKIFKKDKTINDSKLLVSNKAGSVSLSPSISFKREKLSPVAQIDEEVIFFHFQLQRMNIYLKRRRDLSGFVYLKFCRKFKTNIHYKNEIKLAWFDILFTQDCTKLYVEQGKTCKLCVEQGKTCVIR